MSRAIILLWTTVRSTLGAVLVLLEPVVRVVCSVALVLGVFACIIFKLSGAGARFPLGTVLGISLSFGVILILYYLIVSPFVRD